ncbi:MAG: UvrD-helicase domain-containing protein, partial [Clostridia bacterium]|nr:UvrD-helicase domain-containing protein [Clostridia bacterium]
MGILTGLNDKQLEAVRATEGYVRVIAGAGSGKTCLLVSRYAYLVREYGIDPANILCVTFTNKAAGEMKRRIRAMIGEEYDTALICTYHGFCARVLREDPEKLFLSRDFTIIDPPQQKVLLADIYQKYELKLDHASFERMLKKIGSFKGDPNNGYVLRMCDPAKRQIMPSVGSLDDRIMEDYLQRQKSLYALDFDDLMYFTLHLLQSDAEVRDKWQTRLNYIQVDEFQDSSRDEMLLIDVLSEKYKNLMIVGDPDQNIYEWRGSEVGLLVDFDKTHDPTRTIFLNRNYRSTPQILKCANELIDKNELRLKKELYTRTPAGADVFHVHSKTDSDETREIADRIKGIMKSEGAKYSDFAVLYRAGFLSRVVEKRLVEENIPYEIYGGVKFYQRMEVQDAVAYLRMIARDDDAAFKRIINTPRRKFGRVKMAALEAFREEDARARGMSEPEDFPLYRALKEHIDAPAFRGSGAAEFVAFVDEMRREQSGLQLTELVRLTCERSGYEKYIRQLGDEERLDNLTEFKRIADEFERGFGEKVDLAGFLRQVALQSAEDGGRPRDAVKLMTIHASKGLEFPAVFVLGFTEGIFPSSKSIEQRKKAGLEEERRLCYVAMTRAKRHLVIMDSEGVSPRG